MRLIAGRSDRDRGLGMAGLPLLDSASKFRPP
jgi:hypothetical protein